MVATLPIANATCLEWAMRQLYILTPSHVHLAFVSITASTSSTDGASTAVHLVELASLTGGLAASGYGKALAAAGVCERGGVAGG